MSAQQGEQEKVVSGTLKHALKADGGSNRELALRAGISFRAIAEARNGIPRGDLKDRKILGVVASMTRLAISLRVDPTQVLGEIGIDPSDAAVQKQVERAQEASLARRLEEDERDPVMRAIRARELAAPSARKKLGPIVGIVPWKPFSDGDAGGGSVARLLARSVLGSLNPAWNREANLKVEETFVEAEERLLSNAADSPDCLIGLYDLPWRRRGDVDVIPLPGLYVTLGGLCTNQKIRWRDILANRDDGLPHALVIQGDIGDRLLTGPVDYPDARLITPLLETFEPAVVAKRIRLELDRLRPPKEFLFVADGPLVCEVRDALDDSRLGMVEDPGYTPAFRFGFAVRHDSKRFKKLLEEAIAEDLLGHAFPRTVYLYLKLLKSDRSRQIRLNLFEVGDGQDGASRFIDIAKTLEPDDWHKVLNLAALDDKTFKAIALKAEESAPAKAEKTPPTEQ